MARSNIILVGFMGTGKSTVGRLVANRLGMEFVDMDPVIEDRTGRSIAAIFAEDGEARFRSLERALVTELAAREGLVIAAGGGIVLNTDNIRDFNHSGVVICLSAKPDILLQRVERETHRPLLEGGDKTKLLRERLEARRPLYNAISHQIDTTRLTPEAVADRVIALYREASGAA